MAPAITNLAITNLEMTGAREAEPGVDRSARGLPHADVRKATQHDGSQLARALAAAFHDDPVLGHWCLADESRRTARMERAFEIFLRRVHLPHNECYTTSQEVIGGALWLPPGKWRIGMAKQLGLIPALTGALGRSLPRLLRLLSFTESQHLSEPHYYLPLVGVRPEFQGRGIGTALMTPVLERCDQAACPAYLEATSPLNRALYERLGFAVMQEVRLPGDGPLLWLMRRPPRAPATTAVGAHPTMHPSSA